MRRVEFHRRAKRDVRSLAPREQDRIEQALKAVLTPDELPPNADVKALAGAAPWLRLRVGEYRVLFRPLDRAELSARGIDARSGYLVARVVHGGELGRAAAALPEQKK